AFAAQYLAVEKELGLDRTISLGHPLAASGSRILAHLINELHRTNKKYGLGSACIGGGIAMIIERV
ncbi:10239_t:CDS:2, partial [Entrophospora sp. SA101]